ncbi:NAD/NADP-dependent betaine aldehyde dehydrogenase [Streptomyces californicus]
MGSLVGERQLETVARHVEEAVEKGATLIAGGVARPDIGPLFYEPTILDGVEAPMAVCTEETFGPVVSIYRFSDEDEVIGLANATPYGLNSSVWTTDSRRGHDIRPRGATLLAEEIDGFAGSNIGELMGTPLTAHFLGGCPIGASAEEGVIDPYHRLYGHPGISVVDALAVSANLGVNPSLTITAQAERAMSFWPNKGEADPRPEQGAAYERLTPVEPRTPAVPKEAFGALKLPFLGIPVVPPKGTTEAGKGVEGVGNTPVPNP